MSPKVAENEARHRAALRQATQRHHERSEARWIVGDGFSDADAYREFLHALLGLHLKIGHAAALARGDDRGALIEKSRIAALSSDLGQPTRTPRNTWMSPDFGWGVGYVINGSALGASAMLRRGVLCDGWPREYFEQGRDFARSGGVKSYFDDLDRTHLDREQAVAGAIAAFGVLDEFHEVDDGKSGQ